GAICTEGSACYPSQHTLLDLFELAINPQDGRSAIIYTDDALMMDTNGNPLPQIVLAQQTYGYFYDPGMNFSTPVPGGAVPEPASVALVVAAFSLLVFHHRCRTINNRPITSFH